MPTRVRRPGLLAFATLSLSTLAWLTLGPDLSTEADLNRAARSAERAADAHPAAETAPRTATAPRSAAAPGTLRLRLVTGDRITYRFSLRHGAGLSVDRGRFAGSRGRQVGRAGELGLDGLWQIAVLRSGRQGLRLSARVTQLSVSMSLDGQRASAPPRITEALRSQLARPTLVSLGDRGQLSGLRFGAGVDARSRDLVKRIALATFLRLPPGRVDRYRAKETDLTGTFEAEYRLDRAPRAHRGHACVRLVRTKVRYLTLAADMPGKRGWRSIEGRGTVRALLHLGKGHPLKVTLAERFSALTPSGYRIGWQEQGAIEQQALSFDAALAADAARRLASLRKRTRPVDPRQTESRPASPDPRAQAEQRVRGKSVASVVADLAATDPKASSNRDEVRDRFGDLVALFGLSDETVAQGLEVVRDGSVSEHVRSLVLSALGWAGTPAAQRTLLTVLGDRQTPPALRLSTLMALGQVTEPLPQIDAALQRFALSQQEDGLAHSGLLTLGVVTSRTLSSDPARAARAQRWLIARYRDSEERSERIAVLEAFGNIGAPASLRFLSQAAGSKEESIRGAALTGLRKVQTPEATQLLVRRLLRDDSPRVRMRAADALDGRADRATLTALGRALAAEKSEMTRSRILDALAPHRQRAAVREAIQRAASQDASEAIRQRARRLL